MEQPAWLARAWEQFGVSEIADADDNPEIQKYYREVGQRAELHDEVAWCAAFAGAMLARAGAEHTGSLLARSYLNWGTPLDAPRLGAITVLERGQDPGAGHVGFLLGSSKSHVFLLGGNQGNKVSVAAFDIGRVLGYRWPQVNAPVADAPITQAPVSHVKGIFERALAHVLEMEGGFSDDPYDPGGPTNRGITLEDFARWKGVTVDATSRARLVDELKRIADDTVSAIYTNRYWRPAGCPDLPAALGLFHFDAAVNHGTGTAIRLLQSAVDVEADGEIGPLTRAAILAQPVAETLTRYAQFRRARYRALPTFWRFGRGWLNRVDATLRAADAELNVSEKSKTPQVSKGDHTMNNDTSIDPNQKWWLQSRTIWGAIITAAAAVVPVLGPMIGINVPGDVIKQAGDQTLSVVQALAGLFGTFLTIYGRVNATLPLARKDVSVKI